MQEAWSSPADVKLMVTQIHRTGGRNGMFLLGEKPTQRRRKHLPKLKLRAQRLKFESEERTMGRREFSRKSNSSTEGERRWQGEEN